MLDMIRRVNPSRTRLWMTLWLAASVVAAAGATAVAADSMSPRELVPLLTRRGVAPDQTILEVIYAPPFFFEATGLQQPDEMEAQPTLAFIFQETVHDGELPLEVPEIFMLLSDDERIAPYDAGVTAVDDHHRVSRVLFPQPSEWPRAIENADGDATLRLIVPREDGSYSVSNIFEWSVPIEIDGAPVSADG
jgi:hypothetical protein